MPNSLKIYILDAALTLCRDLRDWLVEDRHQVVCGVAERSVLLGLLEYRPDLIVLGLADGDNASMEFYGRLSNHRQLRQVPVLVVSDDANLEYEVLDAFDFQTHPLDRERLRTGLKRLIKGLVFKAGVSFSEVEFATLKSFLLERSGLHFSQHNQRLLERGLMRRVQALRVESAQAYLKYLTATPENYDEVNKLLGLLTVGETSFFRYRSHREALLHFVIPQLLQRNRSTARLRIWSAGCSTGEEPYSLALLLLDNFPELAGWDIQIIATDINKRALRRAREGIYGERSLRTMEDTLKDRYFHKDGRHYVLAQGVKSMVRFEYLNLQAEDFLSDSQVAKDVDLLLCRNVLIYFELDTIRRIVANFSEILSPQGFLFMGHSETMQNVSDRFQRHHQHNAFFYQLKELAPEVKKDGSQETPLQAVAAKRQKVPSPVPSASKKLQEGPAQLYAAAMAAFEHEKFSEAAILFEALLAEQPGNPKALIGKGLLLANQGRYGEARVCCAQAIREDDLLPEAYLLRGLILDMEGLLERALVEYQKVLWLEPAFTMAHYLSAKIYDRLADEEKRQRALRNTIRALEQAADQATVPFSGGLSRGVLLEIAHRELAGPARR